MEVAAHTLWDRYAEASPLDVVFLDLAVGPRDWPEALQFLGVACCGKGPLTESEWAVFEDASASSRRWLA